MMKRFILLAGLLLAGCAPLPTAGTVPVVGTVCAAIDTQKLDLVWKGYDAALDAIQLLISAKVIQPGSPKARAIADANDRVLAALQAAEAAHTACNATSYTQALSAASTGLVAVRAALHGGQ